ncbi:assembly protein for periplasmic nitrate reductase [Paracoccus haematequi]|uniref:Chaperone NapD n=1 Tax=Paracoccus haematequi TaxID=2491866 RepID=A0A447IIT9_9RHOB|nr:chaperone NapD [Paracoccus haematequi]VDS07438.1 assembly protein for periplasmic nitrate reductase [Paracoccus haematequi]
MRKPRWHVSSAVVTVAPDAMPAVRDRVAGMDGVEIHGGDATRLIVTIEGDSTGRLGDRLTEINLIKGVLAASMVFEHAEDKEETSCRLT